MTQDDEEIEGVERYFLGGIMNEQAILEPNKEDGYSYLLEVRKVYSEFYYNPIQKTILNMKYSSWNLYQHPYLRTNQMILNLVYIIIIIIILSYFIDIIYYY